MKIFFKLLIVLSIFLASCSRDRIPSDTLSEIIADIYLVDGYINANYNLIMNADSTRIYESVCKKHGYSQDQFIYTIEYYVDRPGKLKQIYEKSKLILTERQLFLAGEIGRLNSMTLVSEPMKYIISKIDSGKTIDAYQRSLRWITYPDRYVRWVINLPDSVEKKFETPLLGKWWLNNFNPILKPFYTYEKNCSTVPPTSEIKADPKRLLNN